MARPRPTRGRAGYNIFRGRNKTNKSQKPNK